MRSVLYVRTIAEPDARPVLEREAARYETVPSYAANFEHLGIRAIDATLDGAARLADFDVVDEIVLRADHADGLARRTRAIRRGDRSLVVARRGDRR